MGGGFALAAAILDDAHLFLRGEVASLGLLVIMMGITAARGEWL